MIPTKPPPTLKEPKAFSNEFSDFIRMCLVKSPEERPSATALLQHKYIKSAKSVSVLKELVARAMHIVEEEYDSGSVRQRYVLGHCVRTLWCPVGRGGGGGR